MAEPRRRVQLTTLAEPRRIVQLTTLTSTAVLPAVSSPDVVPPPRSPAVTCPGVVPAPRSPAPPVTPGPPLSAPPGHPPSALAAPPLEASDTGTVRLVLTLFEPDEHDFPEFNYGQLIDNQVQKCSEALSRFEEEDQREQEELTALAQKLEEKYGGKPKKKDRVQDLIDIGFGYDDEDSFIDNSEAYDEFVPASITTKLGGFYINSGLLQFRPTSDPETDGPQTEERLKKRKLHSGLEKPKKKRNTKKQTSPSSETPGENEVKKKKKKKLLSVTSVLKRAEKERERQEALSSTPRGPPLSLTLESPIGAPRGVHMSMGPADAAGGGCMSFTGPLSQTADPDLDMDCILVSEDSCSSCPPPLTAKDQPNITTKEQQSIITRDQRKVTAKVQPNITTKDQPNITKGDQPHVSAKDLPNIITKRQPSITAKDQPNITTKDQTNIVEDLANITKGDQPNISTKRQPSITAKDQPYTVDDQPNITVKDQPNITVDDLSQRVGTLDSPQVSEGFPPELQESISKLKEVTVSSDGESKLKFYTPEINSLLLQIELQCRQYGGPLRSRVYSHMTSFLPCNKGTLQRRVRGLVQIHTEEPQDEEGLMKTLREAVGKVMPEQILNWQTSCEQHEQKTKGEAEEKVEDRGGKRGRGPKKQFRWSEEIRESLRRLLKVKMERFRKDTRTEDIRTGHEETRSEEVEEVLKALLETEVKSLWPKGWMPSSVLLKESRKLLGLPGAVLTKKSDKRQSSIDTRPSVPGPPDPLPVADVAPSSSPPEPPSPWTAPPSLSQELLDAAVARYKQKWMFLDTTDSPPLPPPPPQSSPVTPLSATCRVVVPRLALGQTAAKDLG